MSKKDLNENIGGYVDLKPINKLQPTNLEGWEAKFKNFIIEERKKMKL